MYESHTIDRLNQLIEAGEKVVATRIGSPPEVIAPASVDPGTFQQWRTSSLSFLTATMGTQGIHLIEFVSRCEHPYLNDAIAGLAILKAAKDDIEGGYLKKARTLAFADVFENFLDMADHLIQAGYKDPAASLIGAVLENGLRKLAEDNGIDVRTGNDISSLNQKLAGQEVYSRIIQGEIQTQKRIRNAADHGQFEEYDIDQVTRMKEFVSGFLAGYF